MRFMVGEGGLDDKQFEGGYLDLENNLQFEGGTSMDSEEFKDDEDFSDSSRKDKPAKMAGSAL